MSSKQIIDLRRMPRAGEVQPLFGGPSRRDDSPKRKPTLRTRRRRVRALIGLCVVGLCGGVAYGISWVSYMPQFSIQSISVVGAQKVPAGLVSAYAQSVLHDGSHHFFSRQNIFAYPRAVIGKDIATSFPRIKSANVSRASLLATAVTVTIAEREPYALWCADETGACYVLDDSGFVFATAEGATPSTPYIFKGGLTYAMSSTSPSELNPIGHVFASSHLPGLVVLLQLLGQAGLAPTGARVESEQDFTVVFQEGFVLKAAFGEDVGALARDTALVLASAPLKGKGPQIEYIDLRFGNRVYYKLFSGGESAFGGKGETAASSTTN